MCVLTLSIVILDRASLLFKRLPLSLFIWVESKLSILVPFCHSGCMRVLNRRHLVGALVKEFVDRASSFSRVTGSPRKLSVRHSNLWIDETIVIEYVSERMVLLGQHDGLRAMKCHVSKLSL